MGKETFMSETLKASDKGFEEITRLNTLLAMVKNAIIEKSGQYDPNTQFHAGQFYDLDLGLAELHAIEAVLIKALEGELDQVLKNKLLSGSWAEFVEGLEI